jgi:hypothetical protein
MKRAEPGWLVLTLAAVAAAIGSFLPFYTFGLNVELTVWSRSLFPTATLIPVLVVLIGLEALFVLVMGHEPRSPFLNFTWSQARLAGSFFAIVLALSFLVQGRAGGDLGSGYIVLSLSTLATLAGAVLTRRAELVRGRDEIVKAEHPWRAAALRWRRELTAKVEAYAAGTNQGPQRVQPAPGSPDGEKEDDEKPQDEKPAAKAEEPVPKPAPVPRLSAVRTGGEADAQSKKAVPTRKPVKRPPKKKAAAKKTVPKPVEPEADEAKPEQPEAEEPEAEEPEAEEPKSEEPKSEEPKPEEPKPEEPKPEEQKTAELETAELETAEPTAEAQNPEAPKDTDTSDTPQAEDGDAETEPEISVTGDAAPERPAAER